MSITIQKEVLKKGVLFGACDIATLSQREGLAEKDKPSVGGLLQSSG